MDSKAPQTLPNRKKKVLKVENVLGFRKKQISTRNVLQRPSKGTLIPQSSIDCNLTHSKRGKGI